MRSPRAWRRTVFVCTHTPSTQTTKTRAPSLMRKAAMTSHVKSTCRKEREREWEGRGVSPTAARSGGRGGGDMLHNTFYVLCKTAIMHAPDRGSMVL